MFCDEFGNEMCHLITPFVSRRCLAFRKLDRPFGELRERSSCQSGRVSNWNLHLNLALQNPESPEPLPVQVVVLGKETSLANELAWDTQPLIVLFLVLCFEF
jgi:hypothetical protein